MGLAEDVAGGQHRRQHRMILVVVAVKAVAADGLEVREAVHPDLQHVQRPLIFAVIDRIGLGLADDGTVHHRRGRGQTDVFQLLTGKLDQIGIRHRPERVGVVAEIFHPDRRAVGLRHHRRRPGPEILDPADEGMGGVDVDPVVRERIGMVEHQRHDHEIAVFQLVGGGNDLRWRRRVHAMHQLAQRHRVDEGVACLDVSADLAGPGVLLTNLDPGDPHVLMDHPLHPGLHPHLGAVVLQDRGHLLPHLAGAEAGIFELLDQARGVVRPGEGVPDRLEQRQVLDPLRRPVRPDLGAGHAPDLFGIGFEEMRIEPVAEAVHHPLLEGFFAAVREDLVAQQAGDDAEGLVEADVAQRVHRLQRIVIELVAVIDPAQPGHGDEILPHDRLPDLFDLAHLGEKAMSADVETIAAMAFGARDAADDHSGFQHDRFDRRIAALQLVGPGQACRSATYDDNLGKGILYIHNKAPKIGQYDLLH